MQKEEIDRTSETVLKQAVQDTAAAVSKLLAKLNKLKAEQVKLKMSL
ncbi:MAG: hypothetical protein MRQ13_03620 [Candidatus Midichloria sp.]|nr:hypothetical protein [Candidatus Midichloria sp.]